jgi:hypothetical protein
MSDLSNFANELSDLIIKIQQQHPQGKYKFEPGEVEYLQGFWIHRSPGCLPTEPTDKFPLTFTVGTAFFLDKLDADAYCKSLTDTLFTEGPALIFFEQKAFSAQAN